MAKFPKLCKSLEYLVDRFGPIEGRTRLIKLIYLADLEWARKHNTPYTEAKYYRWNNGPYSREILDALRWMNGIELVETMFLHADDDPFFYRSCSRSRLGEVELSPAFVKLLDRVGAQWSGRPLQDLVAHVYGRAHFQDKEFGEPLLQPTGGVPDAPNQE